MGGHSELIKSLDKIARHVVQDPRAGAFLHDLAGAWLKADAENKMLLTPAWLVIVGRDRLDRELEEDLSPYL